MKKFLMIAAACVALASCVKNEVAPVVEQDQAIGFQTAVGLEGTRSTLFPTTKSFIASAYLVEAAEDGTVADWDAIGDEKNLKIPYFVRELVKFIDPNWTTDPAYYWPQHGKLTFYAYANAHIDGVVDENTKDLVFADYDVDLNDSDLLVADIEKDRTAADGLVPVVFRHKLTNVEFYIKKQTNADDRTITLKAIDLRDMQHKGTYTMSSNYTGNEDGWLVGADVKTYQQLTPSSGGVPVTATETKVDVNQDYFMPQELGDNKVLYVEYEIVHNGSTEVVKVAKKLNELDDATGGTADNTWKMNEKVQIVLVVGAPKQIIWEQPEIEGWDVETIYFTI